MDSKSQKSTGWAIILILLGVAAFFGGTQSLLFLIPAATLVWFSAGTSPRRGRN